MKIENLQKTQRFQHYFARARQMLKEEWLWSAIAKYLKNANCTDEEIALIRQELNKECQDY